LNCRNCRLWVCHYGKQQRLLASYAKGDNDRGNDYARAQNGNTVQHLLGTFPSVIAGLTRNLSRLPQKRFAMKLMSSPQLATEYFD
jgi:hypothetical protein